MTQKKVRFGFRVFSLLALTLLGPLTVTACQKKESPAVPPAANGGTAPKADNIPAAIKEEFKNAPH